MKCEDCGVSYSSGTMHSCNPLQHIEKPAFPKIEIKTLQRGDYMDKLVAIYVMGFEQSKFLDGWVKCEGRSYATYPKRYSRDIVAAFEVADKFMKYDIEKFSTGEIYACVSPDPYTKYGAICPTAPEAICKAALLAVTKSDSICT